MSKCEVSSNIAGFLVGSRRLSALGYVAARLRDDSLYSVGDFSKFLLLLSYHDGSN